MPTVPTVTVPSLTISMCPRLAISLQGSLLQIGGYRKLVAEVEKVRREAYDCQNVQHEEMLMKVETPAHRLQSVIPTDVRTSTNRR